MLGRQVSKYWRHKSGGIHNHEPNNETRNHKLAKDLLTKYLNNGGPIFNEIIKSCHENNIGTTITNILDLMYLLAKQLIYVKLGRKFNRISIKPHFIVVF